MIKNKIAWWAVVLVTGALSFGFPAFASQNPQWAQVCSLLNSAAFATCIILTGFPQPEK